MAKLIYKSLLDKSIEAITMAIEIYNKPLTKYRTETSTVLIVNAWENALKALISRKRWAKVYNREKDESKPFDECVSCVKSNLGKLWKESWEDSINKLYKERCRIIHYNKGLAILDYMIIQKNILFFKDFIDQSFGISIIKDKNWFILPIGTELPFDQFNLLSCQSSIKDSPSDIKKYFKSIIETHNKHNAQGNSILMELSITLQNVNRVSKADMIAGIDKNSNEKVALANANFKLGKNGKSITIKEFEKIMNKYPLRYNEMWLEYKKILKQKDIRFDQKKFHRIIKEVKNDSNLSYNWAKLSEVLPIKIYEVYSYSQDVFLKLISSK